MRLSVFAQTFCVLLVVLFSSTACNAQTSRRSRSGESTDREAEAIIAEWLTSEFVTSAQMRQYRDLAARDCNGGQRLTTTELGDCRTVQLALAEEELVAAEQAYEVRIDGLSDLVGEANGTLMEGRWRTVWRYGQRHWRQTRDADCVSFGMATGGGSGVGAGVTRCRAERTLQRAAQLQQR